MISVGIDIPEDYRSIAEYILRLFSSIWGIRLRICASGSEEKPHMVYTSDARKLKQSNIVVIMFDEELYKKDTVCDIVNKGNIHLWTKAGVGGEEADLIASTYRLITFMDELQVKEEDRDRLGRFTSDALTPSRNAVATFPLVESHAQYLLERLLAGNPDLERSAIPRWPNGKKYAVSLTHDTDAIGLSAPGELLINFAKSLIRLSRTHLSMLKGGLHIGRSSSDPFFGFPIWQEYELSNRVPSCFYLYTKPKRTRFDINDCKSSVMNRRTDWEILKKMAEHGWEFGLHASINTKLDLDSFIHAKHSLEEKLGMPVYGLRHHYWSLDWLKPYTTFRKHVNAGFRYDTSIAWVDIPGFRAATCLPFQPFDPYRDTPLQIYELPTCLMDGHVIKDVNDITSAVRAGRDIIQTVKKYGGVAVLDWHTETACNDMLHKNYLTVLKGILQQSLDDSDAWFAAPWEIVEHWHRRASHLTSG